MASSTKKEVGDELRGMSKGLVWSVLKQYIKMWRLKPIKTNQLVDPLL
jgi:hypothetical protein